MVKMTINLSQEKQGANNGSQAPVVKELEELNSKILNVISEQDLDTVQRFASTMKNFLTNYGYELATEYPKEIKKVINAITIASPNILIQPIVYKNKESGTYSVTYLAYAYHSHEFRLRKFKAFIHIYPRDSVLEITINLIG